MGVILSGELAVLQAPMFDGLLFSPFALIEDCWAPAEVGICRRHVAETFVVSAMIIVVDEGLDLSLKIAGQEVVLQQDAVLESLVPSFDLALGLGMHRGTADMAHAIGADPLGQFLGDIARTIIAEQPGLVHDPG